MKVIEPFEPITRETAAGEAVGLIGVITRQIWDEMQHLVWDTEDLDFTRLEKLQRLRDSIDAELNSPLWVHNETNGN